MSKKDYKVQASKGPIFYFRSIVFPGFNSAGKPCKNKENPVATSCSHHCMVTYIDWFLGTARVGISLLRLTLKEGLNNNSKAGSFSE